MQVIAWGVTCHTACVRQRQKDTRIGDGARLGLALCLGGNKGERRPPGTESGIYVVDNISPKNAISGLITETPCWLAGGFSTRAADPRSILRPAAPAESCVNRGHVY